MIIEIRSIFLYKHGDRKKIYFKKNEDQKDYSTKIETEKVIFPKYKTKIADSPL